MNDLLDIKDEDQTHLWLIVLILHPMKPHSVHPLIFISMDCPFYGEFASS